MNTCDWCQLPTAALFIRVIDGCKAFLCFRCVEEHGRQIRRRLYCGAVSSTAQDGRR